MSIKFEFNNNIYHLKLVDTWIAVTIVG